ncbi:hypothetical protein GCM10010399_54040 [Dactylosporangium fulvum]|uniref:BTAD domain-containing putative transcriptional regulator n=1 Tax=Dactylosporangium fulvum TaxID=53359 RepID=UPI0031DA3185
MVGFDDAIAHEVQKMDVCVLGKLEVASGGRMVHLGHPRQQVVIAALAANANSFVSVDELIERVWWESRPQRPRDALHSYISRLRRLLRAADAVTVDHQPGGYRLTVAAAHFDLARFRRNANHARTVSDGESLRLFDLALDEWRGEAFAGIDAPWLDVLRGQLAEERLGVFLDRNESALRLGRHANLLPQLIGYAERYPFDERVAGQLLMVLYRAGRQSEALNRYEKLRRALVKELGTDPGPSLQELYKRILSADPLLFGRATIPKATVRQLPTAPAVFVGRAKPLEQLTRVLLDSGVAGSCPIVVITGPAGIGKTWLGLRWAHDNLDRFPDGQMFLDLRGSNPAGPPITPELGLKALLSSLGVPQDARAPDLAAQAAHYRSALAGQRVLLVLDDVGSVDQVRPLLPGSDGCAVVVTSRAGLHELSVHEGAQPVRLSGMPHEEAIALFAKRLGGDTVAEATPWVERVVTDSLGVPLLLAQAAVRAFTLRASLAENRSKNSRPSPLADLLGRTRGALSARPAPIEQAGRVARRQLGPDRRRVEVRLTAEGSAAFERHASVKGRGATALLSVLTAEERQTLADLLRKLVVAAESGDGTATGG